MKCKEDTVLIVMIVAITIVLLFGLHATYKAEVLRNQEFSTRK